MSFQNQVLILSVILEFQHKSTFPCLSISSTLTAFLLPYTYSNLSILGTLERFIKLSALSTMCILECSFWNTSYSKSFAYFCFSKINFEVLSPYVVCIVTQSAEYHKKGNILRFTHNCVKYEVFPAYVKQYFPFLHNMTR